MNKREYEIMVAKKKTTAIKIAVEAMNLIEKYTQTQPARTILISESGFWIFKKPARLLTQHRIYLSYLLKELLHGYNIVYDSNYETDDTINYYSVMQNIIDCLKLKGYEIVTNECFTTLTITKENKL